MISPAILIRQIITLLFSAETRRLETIIKDLHKQNQEILRLRLDGFMWEGKFYKPDSINGPGLRKSLDLSLWPIMYDYKQQLETIELDKSLIAQMLFILLQNSISYQDLRDAIPECIVDILPNEISSLERRRNPKHFLNHPRDFRQYDKILPKIEFYSATRLIY